MLFECLTGLVPFPREDDVAVLHAHVWDPRPRPNEIRSELPAALDEVIASGMERHPEARAHGARELVRAAQATLDCAPDGSVVDQPVTIATRELDEATVQPQRAAPMRPRSPRFSMRAAALAGVVAVALGAGGGAVVERARSQTAQAPTPPAKPKVDVRYPRALDATLAALNRSEASLAKDLRSAKTASAQATALARLAGAFASADRAASDLQPPNRARVANAAIVTALG